MSSEIVNLKVTANIAIDCDFWSEGDGWEGLCKSPAATVRGSGFEDAKKNMATELQEQIEEILSKQPETRARKAQQRLSARVSRGDSAQTQVEG